MKASVEHSSAVFADGLWSCEVCGSESLDFELFEEAGEIEGCLSRGGGVAHGGETEVGFPDVERVREWMEASRVSFETMGRAAEKATTQMQELMGILAVANERKTTVIDND